MVAGQAHEEKGHKQDVPRKCPDMKGIQRIKVVTGECHQDAAHLSAESDEKGKPKNIKKSGHEPDDSIRTFFNHCENPDWKETRIRFLESGGQIIVSHGNEGRDDVRSDRHGHGDPEKTEADGGALFKKKPVPEF